MSNSRGHIEMVAAMLLMGTVGYFVIESKMDPHSVVFFRCLFGATFLAIYCSIFGLFKNTGIGKHNIVPLLLSGVFLVCNWMMLFASFESASISTSTAVYHVQPFFFALIWAAAYRDPIPLTKIAWMIIAFIGVAMVSDIHLSSLSSDHLPGILLALSAAILWAISAVFVKQIKDVRPHLITLVQLTIGVFMLLPFTNLTMLNTTSYLQWQHLVTLGFVHTCLVYVFMYSAYQKLSTPTIAVLTFIYPAVAILVDYVFYGKALSVIQFLGVSLIMLSSFGASQNIVLPFLSWKKA
ncbi:EamA family transporter [Ketobacter sp. MCCC 1A13808]|nr:EamA family transporter [Ketobacter sp. MCCC 1A13808]